MIKFHPRYAIVVEDYTYQDRDIRAESYKSRILELF